MQKTSELKMSLLGRADLCLVPRVFLMEWKCHYFQQKLESIYMSIKLSYFTLGAFYVDKMLNLT